MNYCNFVLVQVVAGSQENGQDYEHVQMLQERFQQFARDTENIGSERVARANDGCDAVSCSEIEPLTVYPAKLCIFFFAKH